MVKQLIECVPNFSEGRRKEVIEEIIAPFRSREGCFLLDHRADEDHNRLVVSVAGYPEDVCEALLEASRVAIEKIDLNVHRGGHPRIGAVDVIPFTPLKGITMNECVKLSRDFGKRFWEEMKVPVYFYEESAARPERKKLENIRRGQYEVLKEGISDPARHPDVGEPVLHPTAGAIVTGARKFLVAFNVNLKTDDLETAKDIAAKVRASGGGLSHVKAIALPLADRKMVQVSMNIVDYERNSLYTVLEMVRSEARRWGTEVAETEIYGMIPAGALLESVASYMQIAGFDPSQVLELKMLEVAGAEDNGKTLS